MEPPALLPSARKTGERLTSNLSSHLLVPFGAEVGADVGGAIVGIGREKFLGIVGTAGGLSTGPNAGVPPPGV